MLQTWRWYLTIKVYRWLHRWAPIAVAERWAQVSGLRARLEEALGDA